jgi:hypothetical protein
MGVYEQTTMPKSERELMMGRAAEQPETPEPRIERYRDRDR